MTNRSASRALVMILVAGCAAEQPIELDRPRTLVGPIPLKHQVAWADSALDRVVAVDVAGDGAPVAQAWPIGRRPVYAVPTPSGERLLVVTRGEEAIARGQVDEDPILWNVNLAAPGTTPEAYAVGSPFDRIAVSEDGAIAVAYFSEGGPDSEGFFRNPNELAFIDLSRPPGDDNPVIKTIRSFGSAPTGIVLSPPMAIPGSADASQRIFAFVLAPNVLTIVDATHPARDEVSIRLDAASEGTNVVPQELVFAPSTATAYMRSDGARDVLEIVLLDDPPPPDRPSANDYRPLLAELGAGGGPSDIAVFDDPNGRRFVLAATPNTREVVVIDADTAQFRRVATPLPIDRITLFPVDAMPAHRAVLADLGATEVYSLALDDVADPLARLDVDPIAVGSPVRELVAVPGRDLAMMVHDDDRTVLGLLDVAVGSVAPLQGIGRLDSYAFTPTGEYLTGTTAGVMRLGLLELGNLHPTDLRLDFLPTRVFALPSGAIVVDHDDPFGRITVLPTTAAERRDATVLSGFLLADLLETE
jgi:hypothetical protein